MRNKNPAQTSSIHKSNRGENRLLSLNSRRVNKIMNPFQKFQSTSLSALSVIAGITCITLPINTIWTKEAHATPAMLEFRWDNSTGYKKLYYWQGSSNKRARSTYYLVLKPRDRRTSILKLNITIPDHFNAKIKTKKLNLCKVNVGGMLSKTECIQKIPAVFAVTNNQKAIEVFPERPIPAEGSYAVVMKIFNPGKTGMYQFNAMAQSPGDIPTTRYIGSWTIDID